MNLVGLPHDVLLQILECCNAASLLNLELVCQRFHRYIALYESLLRRNLFKKYSWDVYDLWDFPSDGCSAGFKPFLLWCAHFDVMLDLAVYKQIWRWCPKHFTFSHFCHMKPGTELVRSLEHGLAIYQRCAALANNPRSHVSNFKLWLRSRHPWARSPAEPEPIYIRYKEIHQKYIQSLSSVAVFDFELLYQVVLYGHAVGFGSERRGLFRITYPTGLEVLKTVARLRTARIPAPASKSRQSHNPLLRWTRRLSELSQEIFRFRDRAGPSFSWEEYRNIPLAVRMEALPITQQAEAKTSRDHFELATVMHRYIEKKRPVEAKKARVVNERAGCLDLVHPIQDGCDPCQ